MASLRSLISFVWCLAAATVVQAGTTDYVGSLVSTLYAPGFDVTPDACGDDVRLLVMVHSGCSGRKDARDAARFTWATFGSQRDVRVVFLLGRSSNDAVPEDVLAESSLYSDVAVSRNVDSFDNLTLKAVASTEWVSSNCPGARFVVMLDDDVFLNFPRLLHLLELNDTKTASKTMFGRVQKGSSPIREPNNKYYIPDHVYSGDKYPPYLQGGAYLFTGDLSKHLFSTALRMSFFRMQDLFFTSFLGGKVGATLSDVQDFIVDKWWEGRKWGDKAYICDLKKKVAVHPADYEAMFDMWVMSFDKDAKC